MGVMGMDAVKRTVVEVDFCKKNPRLDYQRLIEDTAAALLGGAPKSVIAVDLLRIANEIRKDKNS